MKGNLQNKIFNSLNNWKLKIIEWKRKWYKYILSIQNLSVERNNQNGLLIHVYDCEENFLDIVNIEIKPVVEFWCVHDRMFLID